VGLTPFPATLCLHLANLARASVFIETGTYLGETARWAAEFFSDVRTIELGAERYAETSAALRDLSNVVCYQGDSRAVLAKIREELAGTPSVMWLDGHWSGDGTAGEDDECPLLGELECVDGLKDIVMIDDARYFLRVPPPPHEPDQWPTLQEIVLALPPGMFVQVVHDVIFVVPDFLRGALTDFLREERCPWKECPAASSAPLRASTSSAAVARGAGVERSSAARPLLSACLIVRDEAAHVGDCLRSLAGLVDEAVVVDTGSRDDTAALARAAGARVFESRWRGSFAAARNESLRHARGDWILYLDADERVVTGVRHELEGVLSDPQLAACTVAFRPVTGYTRYRERRLFRRHPAIRFEGVIHETIGPSLARLAAEGLRIGSSDVAIDHLGYDGDLGRKHRRNVPLLRRRLAGDPLHVYSWHDLGCALEALGEEAEAEACWRRAVDIVRAKPVPAETDLVPFLDLLRLRQRRGEDVGALLGEALQRFPGSPLLDWMEARELIARGLHGAALPRLERLASFDAGSFCDAGVAFEQRILTELCCEALGLCCWALGRFAAAAAWYERAAQAAPERLDYRLKAQLAASRAAPDRTRTAQP
jgi:hypothetical protein